MAIYTLYRAPIFGSTIGVVTYFDSTRITIVAGSVTQNYYGYGFNYSQSGQVVGGTLTGTDLSDSANGGMQYQITGLSHSAPMVYHYVTAGNPAALTAFLLDGNDTINGTAGADELQGFTGADAVYGGGGNDTILANYDSMADTLYGGQGDDLYRIGLFLSDSIDTIIEYTNEGIDTVEAEGEYTLGANLDRLVLKPATFNFGALTGIGNGLDNQITAEGAQASLSGMGGNDTLIAAAGDFSDTLDGGNGNDLMTGDGGDDFYAVDNASDQIIDSAGIDTVRSSYSGYSLGNDLENLVLTGAAVAGTGNGQANLIIGNLLSSVLYGLGGDDILIGDGAADTLVGGDGNDLLDGGAGVDSLVGGTGDDDFLLTGTTLDTIIELADEGIDTVRTAVSGYQLAANVENLVLLAGALSGTGNVLDNVLQGNAAANTLDGGEGVDTMNGGGGDDTYYANNAGDRAVEVDGAGTDTILTTVSYNLADSPFVENITLLGAGDLTAQGNQANNVIRGNTGNNLLTSANLYGSDWLYGGEGNDTLAGSDQRNNNLDGGAGADLMMGGLGRDTYTVDNVADVVIDVWQSGVENIVYSWVSYTLPTNISALHLLGSEALNLTAVDAGELYGNSAANVLTGGVRMYGGGGNDTLFASQNGTATTILEGGAGDDTYHAYSFYNRIQENANEGYDTVYSYVLGGFTLTSNFEKLVLLGNGESGIGNASDNLIVGNERNNFLAGYAGADTLTGGKGNDTYYADAGDFIVELAGEGIDMVHVTGGSSFSLAGTEIENLNLMATDYGPVNSNANSSGTGNEKDNYIAGTYGNNNIDARGGNDTIKGDFGNDTIDGGDGVDTVIVDWFRTSTFIIRGQGTYTLTTGDQVDVLRNVEKVTFYDGTLVLDSLRMAKPDFNADGKGDLLWRNTQTGANAVWRSADSSKVQAVATVSDPVNWKVMGTGDFNGDGTADILWRNLSTGANSVWLGGNSATSLDVAPLVDTLWKLVGIGDFDGDGQSDILWRNSATGANTIWKSANGAAAQVMAPVSDLNWKAGGIGDFNGDRKADILWRNAVTGENTIWLGGNSATGQSVAPLTDLNWKLAGVGDFNNDGQDDLLWRNSVTGANAIWESADGDTGRDVATVADQAWVVQGTGDYDGDGYADILWRNTTTGANTIWREGYSFAPIDVTTIGDTSWELQAQTGTWGNDKLAMVAYDFDGDGKSDLLWRNTTSGANAIWKNADAGNGAGVTPISDTSWKAAGVADFDGDGKADILWRNATSGANTIWKSAGSATGQDVTTIGDTSWKVAGVGDFDGDGKADILWRHISSGANTIWKSANSATGQDVTTIGDTNWKVGGIGDFDGDGKADILWRNFATGANTIWKSGNSSTGQDVTPLTDMTWALVGTGDFNGDGKDDIVWRNSVSGANAIWRGADSSQGQDVPVIGDTNWKLAGTGDYNGDGKDDLLWRNASTGGSTVWHSASGADTVAVVGISDPAWTNPVQTGVWVDA